MTAQNNTQVKTTYNTDTWKTDTHARKIKLSMRVGILIFIIWFNNKCHYIVVLLARSGQSIKVRLNNGISRIWMKWSRRCIPKTKTHILWINQRNWPRSNTLYSSCKKLKFIRFLTGTSACDKDCLVKGFHFR